MKLALLFGFVFLLPAALAFEAATLDAARRKGVSVAIGEHVGCIIQTEAGSDTWGRCFGTEVWSGSWQTPPRLKAPVSVLAPSRESVCALDAEGVKCWGDQPIAHVPSLKSPYLLAADNRIACAVDEAGLKCWGTDSWEFVIRNPTIAPGTSTYVYPTIPLNRGLKATFLKMNEYNYIIGLSDGSIQVGGNDADLLRKFFEAKTYQADELGISHRWICKKYPQLMHCHPLHGNSKNILRPLNSTFGGLALGHDLFCLAQDEAILCHGDDSPFEELKDLPPFIKPRQVFAGYGTICVEGGSRIACSGALDGELRDGQLGTSGPSTAKFVVATAATVASVAKPGKPAKSGKPKSGLTSPPVKTSPPSGAPTRFEDL